MGKDLKGRELGNGILQRKDGKYCARYVSRFGKRETIYNTSLTKLRQELNKAIYTDNEKSNVVDSSVVLDQWFDKWINIYKSGTIGSSTRRIYKHVYGKNISPVLGQRRLSEIKHLEIVALIKELHNQGYEYSTKNKVRIILLDIFNKAMIDEFWIVNSKLDNFFKGICSKLTRC